MDIGILYDVCALGGCWKPPDSSLRESKDFLSFPFTLSGDQSQQSQDCSDQSICVRLQTGDRYNIVKAGAELQCEYNRNSLTRGLTEVDKATA